MTVAVGNGYCGHKSPFRADLSALTAPRNAAASEKIEPAPLPLPDYRMVDVEFGEARLFAEILVFVIVKKSWHFSG